MAGVRPRRLMRPALRTRGDLDGTGGSFASYAELDEDRQQLAADVDALASELALALALLDQLATLVTASSGPYAEANNLLVRHGIREAL